MKGKRRRDSYKIIFFLCQPELQPGNGQVPQGNVGWLSWKAILRRAYNTSKCRISSLTAFALESSCDSSILESETFMEGESCILFIRHPPILTSWTRIFFSEPYGPVWHHFLPVEPARLTAQDWVGTPDLGREYTIVTGHWDPGQMVQAGNGELPT